jgi:hypothetical protein
VSLLRAPAVDRVDYNTSKILRCVDASMRRYPKYEAHVVDFTLGDRRSGGPSIGPIKCLPNFSDNGEIGKLGVGFVRLSLAVLASADSVKGHAPQNPFNSFNWQAIGDLTHSPRLA